MTDESHSTKQAAEINEARTSVVSTIRPTVPALEAMLFQAFPILDHGFVRVIDYMGEVPWEDYPAAKLWYAKAKSRPSFRPLLADRFPGLPPAAHYDDLDF